MIRRLKITKSIIFSIVIFIMFYSLAIQTDARIQGRKKIAITIDDLPTLSHGKIDVPEQTNYFKKILVTLEKYEIQSVGFVLGQKINSHNKELIELFLQSGHQIGNHTYSHPDLNNVAVEEYIKDINVCQQVLQAFNTPIKYFRYPMLHRGDTEFKRDAIHNYLKQTNLKIVPVTIDSDEVAYNIRFVNAFYQKKISESESIGEEYIRHMISQTIHYDDMAHELLNRPIKHILLLHMNFINSFYLDDLMAWYKANNWEFITLDDALTDPLYSMKDHYIGKRGISYLERISIKEY